MAQALPHTDEQSATIPTTCPACHTVLQERTALSTSAAPSRAAYRCPACTMRDTPDLHPVASMV